jgi:hypothetical protein
MVVLSVLGLLVWLGGLGALIVQGIRWSGRTRGEGKSVEPGETLPLTEIPDTVPPEWIDAYRTVGDERSQAGHQEGPMQP